MSCQSSLQSSLTVCEEILAGKATWEKIFEPPNFFCKYRHFIVLEASSNSEEDQLTWEGLVESKVRHLVANLEREAISLAHVWPKSYRSLVEGCDKVCCYWFIGLKVELKEGNTGGQLDLTTPIKAFTDIVMRSAIQINVWKTGMKIVADYKKRKELKEYLPHDEHWKLKSEKTDRKSVEKTAAATATTTVTASLSPDSAAALVEGTAAKLTTQTSEEKKRSLSLMEMEAGTPPPKKCFTENSEAEVIEEAESEIVENNESAQENSAA